MLKSFAQVKEKAAGAKKRLVVADAAGVEVIKAIYQATDMGMVEPILVGDAAKIEPILADLSISDLRIVHETDPVAIAAKSVELIRSGEGDMLMKGKLSTPILMKAVLDKENGLRKGKLLSHVAVMEVEGYPKLMLVTDGGIVIDPSLGEKVVILNNAAQLANSLGIELPKVACLAAIERISEKQPETMHAAQLVKMAERRQLSPMIVEGPIAMDVILSKEAARAKGIESEMTLDADIVLVPNIATGNAVVKALIYLAGAMIGGVILGAACPIVLLSRADTAEIKLCSIATACVASKS
ncbi:phosphate butyryltransferase [bacterium]|nr:phosphate butyryltransferase [bacterium]